MTLALGITATACGGSDDSKSSGGNQSAVQGEAKSGGSMTMLAVQDSASLDPFKASSVAVADEPRLAALYDPLFYIDKDNSVKPHLGEALTTSDNGKTWLLKLRPGVVFSDGTPLNAEAVKVNWDMHAKADVQSLHRQIAAGLTTKVVDPTTVEITPLGMPNANLDRAIAIDLTYIASPASLAKGPDEYRNRPVGAGPFKLESWTRGSQQVFVKNDRYWQKDKGLPKLDKLTIKNVPDIKQQYNTVNSGGADVFVSSDNATIAQAEKEIGVVQRSVDGGQMIQFNMTRPPFDDLRARQAITLALDPAGIPRTLANGYVPAKGFFAQKSPFYDPAAVQAAPDKAKAKQLFDELEREGKKVEFTYLLPQNPSSVKVAEWMQTQLADYKNVSMKLEPLEIGAYVEKYAFRKDFQAMLFQQWLADPEPVTFNNWFSKSPTNFVGWKSDVVDGALLAGRNSTDPAVRKKAASDLSKAMVADLPAWTYAESSIAAISNKKVTGVVQFNTGVFFMDRIGFK
ncbi:ABC transporter substrate-binding protein [Embleya hyalina]|uniref:Peptide ABC transporter substrate-binding protein n=1 Tax=Embleya hyalina TaxID=516124 RepID=A0A401Z2R3_9ACTN|nr:ABC transporter substrate-binding protein [Embleya hyalina]GCE01175.1 peptide ABC transporter substrate-binding protein [Embleya hyalina]